METADELIFDLEATMDEIQAVSKNIWVDVILNDRVRRMYRLSDLRNFQREKLQLLFDWTNLE